MPAETKASLLSLLQIPTEAQPPLFPVVNLRSLYNHHQARANDYASEIVCSGNEHDIIKAVDRYAFHRAAARTLAGYLDSMRSMVVNVD